MNKKIFALLALVGLMVAPATTWALGSYHYAQLDLSVIKEEGGLVCATTSSATPESGFGVTSSSGSVRSGSESLIRQNIVIYAHAQKNEGWEFLGWFDNAEGSGDPKSKDNPYKCTISASSTSSDSPTKEEMYAKFRDPSVKIPFSEVAFKLSASSLDYTGSERSVSISEVSYAGGSLTKDVDYVIDATSVFAATGSARSNETYKVIINAVDGSGYTGSATNEWKILAPSGSFAADALSTTTEGCTVNGTKLTVADSTKLVYADGKWAMSLTAELTHDTIVINPSPLVHFADAARGLAFTAEEAEGRSDLISITGGKTKIALGNYAGKTDVQKFTWTEGFTLEEIEAAKSSGVLCRTLTVYEVAYSEKVALVTLSNNGGLRETTLVMEVPIDEKLKLLDQYGNQMYPALAYVAENTTTHRKYLSLTNALEASEANQTNILIAAGEKADFTIPQNVAVNLEGFGHAEATYLLSAADNALGAMLVSSNAEEVATQKGFEIVTNFENAVYTYTLQKGHVHAWGNFNAESNVLTATCINYEKDCTIEGRTITLTLMAEDKVYDGKAPNAGFDKDERALFEELLSEDPQHMLSIGEVGYTRPDYSAGNWYAGEYTAFVTVQIGGVDYKLEKEFSITKPQGGYTDGFETAVGGYDVRFDTFAEAASASADNATVCYRGGNLNQKTIYFSSDKDITLDLGGKTLTYEANEKMTIRNDGTGKVTFVNGTIVQPKGLSANHITLTGSNGGSMAFGAGIVFVNKATNSDNYLTVTVDGISVEIVDGKYQAGFKVENAGFLLVKGGDFTVDPSAFLAEGYAIGKQKVAGYPYSIIEHVHEFSFTAEGNAITCHCTDSDCYYDGVSTKLVAEDVMYDGETHGARLDPAPGEGFPNVKISFSYTTADGIGINGIPFEVGEYIATATVDASVAPGVQVSVRYRITDRRPFDLSAIQPQGGEAAGRVLERSTLTVTNGVALKYCTADEAPDGSGIEGWYVGMKVTWPNENSLIRGFSRLEDAKFTMNAIKGDDGQKRIFNGEEANRGEVPGLSVEKFGIPDTDLFRITSFIWWERVVVADVKAAVNAGNETIERELTAWGVTWKKRIGGDIIGVDYGDEDGVAEYTFKIVVNLADLELSDGTYIYWPEHAHDWSYVVNENSITATCSIAECPYSAGVWAEFGPKTVASRLGSPEPLEAAFHGIEKFVGATEATVGEIEYWQGGTKLDAAPIQPGLYVAKVVLTLADGVTTHDFMTTLEIEAGAIVVDGQHYALGDVPKFVEKMILDGFTKDMYISVGKNFTAERAYTVPAPLLSTDFAGMKTKYFDLNGFSITGAVDQVFFENKGKLVLSDSSEGQTGRMVTNPENTADVPLIINRAGKATKVLEVDVIESYGAELTIESGIYLGMISNEVGAVVEVLGQPMVDLSAKILIKGGKFLYRPEDGWLDDGCYIREETLKDGTPVFAVYPHVHEYKFVSLGSFVVGYCTARDEGQGLLEPSSCKAKVVLMTAFMQDRPYDARAVECKDGNFEVEMLDILLKLITGKLDDVDVSGAYYINLSAIFRSGFDFNDLIDTLEGKTSAKTIQERIEEFGKKIGDWVDQLLNRGQEQAIVVDENEGHLSRLEFEKLTGAKVTGPSWTTNASLIDEIFGDEDEPLEGAPKDAGKYKVRFDILTPSENTVTVKNPFEITPLPIEEVTITTIPATNLFICSGKQEGYASINVYSSVDKAYLTVDTDYMIGNVTNATNVGDYFFQVIGMRNYEGVTNIYWSIVAPSREFPVDTLTALDDDMNGMGSYGFVEDNTLFVSNPPAIYFDIATESWLLGLTINWPNESGNRTKAEDAKITLPDGTECSVADLVNGIVEFEGITAEVDDEGFVKTVTYQVYLSPEEVFTARDEFDGLTDFVYSFKVGALATKDNVQGFKPTEFSLVIPLGNLELYDCNGFRVYPVHLHKWQFETVKGYILEAKCVADPKYELDCPFDGPTPTLHLGRTEYDEFEYTGNRREFLLNENEVSEFRYATGVIVGKVVYYQNGVQLPEPPINVGDYSATVKIIPMGADPYMLTKEFKIVKPSGGYVDGFEVGSTGVRYDTYAEAVAAVTNNGDTVYCHQDIVKNEINLTTPYDITLDLCGKTVTGDADMTIVNDNATTIKVVNGTFEQPRHYTLYIIQSADQAEASKGSFVFGEGLRLRNVALASYNYFTVTVGKNASLRIEDGAYNAKFTGSGKIEIVGGLFWREFDPTEYVPEGYVVRSIIGDFAYEVLPDTVELVQGMALPSVERLVMSMEDDSARHKVATIVGSSIERARELKTWLAEYGITSRDLALSDHAKASFALGTSLIDGKEVKIRDVAMGKDGLEFRLAVADGAHSETVRTTADRIASFLQRATDLETGFVGTVNPADLNVGADGKIIIRGEPRIGTLLIRFLAPRDK